MSIGDALSAYLVLKADTTLLAGDIEKQVKNPNEVKGDEVGKDGK
jgi:hypothetical protein